MSSRSKDNGLLACRAKQVSERIYRNHLKTRFSNIQERHKLTTHINELDRQEKHTWRELDHKKKELEERFQRIMEAREAALKSSITSQHRKESSTSTNSSKSSSKSSSSLKKLEPAKRNFKKRPSYTSLLNPFISDKMEYEEILGYAQHMTKKQTRKSSTIQEDIGLSDIAEMKNNLYCCKTKSDRFHSKEKSKLIRGLEKRAKRERTTMNKISHKISTLPPAVLEEVEEDGPRYIRIPECRTPTSTPSISPRPEPKSPTLDRPLSPKLTYEQQLSCVDGVVTKESIKLPQMVLGLLASNQQYLKYRRGSKSLSAIEMMKYLPTQSLGRCVSVEHNNLGLADRLSLFQAKMDHMRRHDQPKDIKIAPAAQLAPPPRDEYAPRERPTGWRMLRETRMSKVDVYELGKWRQSMAENDHIPEIVRCRYIRTPGGSPVYNFKTGRFEEVTEDGMPSIPPLEIINALKDANRRESTGAADRRGSTTTDTGTDRRASTDWDRRGSKDRRVSSCETIDIAGEDKKTVNIHEIVMMLLKGKTGTKDAG